jgi:hypothetical protein
MDDIDAMLNKMEVGIQRARLEWEAVLWARRAKDELDQREQELDRRETEVCDREERLRRVQGQLDPREDLRRILLNTPSRFLVWKESGKDWLKFLNDA